MEYMLEVKGVYEHGGEERIWLKSLCMAERREFVEKFVH